MDATLTMTTPGEVVRRYRKAAALSQAAVAAQIGVTVGMITSYENGTYEPTKPTARRLDEALKAGGRVLKAYGFTPPDDVDETLDEMRGLIGDLTRQVRELTSIVEDLRRRDNGDA